jgi:hypothetical protein
VSDNYIIEIRPNSAGITVQAGIVVRDGHGFRFFAATDAFYGLERQFFKSPRAAEKAASRYVAELRSRSCLPCGDHAASRASAAMSQWQTPTKNLGPGRGSSQTAEHLYAIRKVTR